MLSQGPFSYNRFDQMDALYQKVYESKKKADKDYDGDGKVESGTAEYMGSRDKAIKKAMGKSVKEAEEKKDLPPFMKDKKDEKKGGKKDKCECKEEVLQHLMDEGFANNPVSAEVLFNHMSEEWLASIEEAYKTMSAKATNMSKRRSADLSDQEYKAAGSGDSGKTNQIMQKKIKVMDARQRHGKPGMR